MNSYKTQLIFCLCSLVLNVSYSAKVLIFSSLYLGDEKAIENQFAKILALEGHRVTILRFENTAQSPEQIKDVDINLLRVNTDVCKHSYFNEDGVLDFPHNYSWVLPRRRATLGFDFMTMHICQCQVLINDEKLLAKLQKENYQVALVNIFFNECSLALAHLLKIPTISFSTVPSVGGQQFYSGVMELPAVVPLLMSELTGGMKFTERLYNVFTFVEYKIFYAVHYSNINSYIQKIHPDTPSVQDLLADTALLITTTDLILEHPRATTRNVIPIGCITCRLMKEVPESLSAFLNSTKDKSAIVINFGYLGAKVEWIPSQFIRELEEFIKGSVKNFVVTFDSPTISKLTNVYVDKKTPLQDILGQTEVELIVTSCHGNDLMEAMDRMVPILCIPIFLDQGDNAARVVEIDVGRSLDVLEFTGEAMEKLVEDMLMPNNYSRMRNNQVQYVSFQRSDFVNPVTTFIHWVKMVLVYRDLEHLKLGNRKLNIFQYYSCDVVLMLFLIFYTIRVVLKYFIRLLKLVLFSRKTEEKQKKQ